MNLRPYQEEGLNAIRDALRKGERRILYVLPTGGGKTVMFATIARGAASRTNRVLILVHRREIMEQTLDKLYQMGVVSGQIASDKPLTSDYVQTGMVMTVARRLKVLKRPDLIIVDEAHHALQDNSWGKILKYWSDVPVIGFTATPERLDGRGLGETFSCLIEGPSIAELVEQGWLAPPVMYRPPEELIGKFHVKRGDFDRSEQEMFLARRRIIGDVIEHYRKHLDGLPVVVFCVSVRHSEIVRDMFLSAGYRAEAVWGNMPRAEREAAIQGLADGSVQVVTSCDVISEGVDVPVMAGAILLRRTMSSALYLQQVGRALRRHPGKKYAVVLDHVGNYYLHGHVLAERTWSLDTTRRDPRKASTPETTTCPSCYGIWPGHPHKCPACGHEFIDTEKKQSQKKPFVVVAAELEQACPGLDSSEIGALAGFINNIQNMPPGKRLRAMWGKAYQLARANTPDEARRKIDQLRKQVGYKPGWTSHVWKEIQKNIGRSA